VNFIRARLQGAILSSGALGEDLVGISLNATQLQGANLSNVILDGVNLHLAELQGADMEHASLRGADLSYAKLQGADLEYANLKGADLRHAQLQGANLESADLQGADLGGAEVWLASFPVDLFNRWPGPIGGADLDMSPLTPEGKAKLKLDLQGGIANRNLLESLFDRLDPILRDHSPRWRDQDRWSLLVKQTHEEQPSADEIVQFLADMACDDTEGLIAGRMVQRVEVYSENDGRRFHARALAQALLNANCEGAKLTNETRARLEGLASATE
jgi:uncharacterized protein YjbI with pentapeptide repeats